MMVANAEPLLALMHSAPLLSPPRMKKCGKLKRSPGLCGSACAARTHARFVQPRSTSSRLSCSCQAADAGSAEIGMRLEMVSGQLPWLQRAINVGGWLVGGRAGGWIGVWVRVCVGGQLY